MFAFPGGITFQRIDDEGIIVNATTGQYLSLNATGTLMLQSIIEYDSKEIAVQEVLRKFKGDRVTVEADLESFVKQLSQLGLLDYQVE